MLLDGAGGYGNLLSVTIRDNLKLGIYSTAFRDLRFIPRPFVVCSDCLIRRSAPLRRAVVVSTEMNPEVKRNKSVAPSPLPWSMFEFIQLRGVVTERCGFAGTDPSDPLSIPSAA